MIGTAPEDDKTPPQLKRRLKDALKEANLGVPQSWGLERRASYALRLLSGGTVRFSAPQTVRRAISVLENDR